MHFDGSLILGFFRILHPPPPYVPSRRPKRSSFQSRASARACTADAHASASTILCVVCACVYFLPTRSDGTRFEYAIVHYVFVHLVLYIHAMCFFLCVCACVVQFNVYVMYAVYVHAAAAAASARYTRKVLCKIVLGVDGTSRLARRDATRRATRRRH